MIYGLGVDVCEWVWACARMSQKKIYIKVYKEN